MLKHTILGLSRTACAWKNTWTAVWPSHSLAQSQKANFGRGQNLPFGKAALQGFDKRTKNQREYGILL
ncbi:MAG: hypothetical protein COW11_03260 [Candidatus Omnitrophica bacterium CG12_big_fil_rev_8_21_14_0_65_43_15]|uniref:Uncharacterized protein n=1 Tax=Candidatus Taenaricola geysiri TaxID=1974752 RepID=A0A2J0LRI2_9BACT|nr:MAG: hypothetical protein AUJ89_01210 [Candidatus Omnitrophica bacterium CG1_02_43_210]PIV11692.1 MAG: hypothetical protein COS48_04690 [Candidatus Omnitrophica bacterium CG03_land_8_20_14_0_80_43_22]PIW66447.1 MAG: hypothetical protein COW11_03260 [Candidatus Omnitrophica bacterium CG12_big_fil_rev_8_21_14_0_65_43_15]PIW79801.1 MAG: hypothetical protein COZ98_05675 [Candidatus Omnitrophica bacterium CG_4_8_14_3_um_filter_43_15]